MSDPVHEQIQENVSVVLNDEQLEAVRKQIEYYFSKENLQSDQFLASQMDANKSVPISLIMKFAKLKALTQDEVMVKKALINSQVVAVVDDRIKLNAKSSGRSTIILREIPIDASEDEIREIFNFDGCKTVVSLRSDIENTWFVVMESEEDAKDTVVDLKIKNRLFRGEKVKARVKTETTVRSYFPLQPTPVIPPAVFPPFAGGYGNMQMDMRSMYGYNSSAANQSSSPSSPTSHSESSPKPDSNNENGSVSGDRKNNTSGIRQHKDKDGNKKFDRNDRQNNTFRRGGDRTIRNGQRPDRKDSSKAPIEIDAVNFPPLPNIDDTPVPTPGYEGEYIKYSFDDVINIVKNIKDAQLPDDITPDKHSLAMTVTPNLDLLQRQRTFSIDETREQLNQGRPVQRLAVSAGAVDYGSMMYGDDNSSTHHAAPAPSTTSQPHTKSSWAALVKSNNESKPISAQNKPVTKSENKSKPKAEKPKESKPQEKKVETVPVESSSMESLASAVSEVVLAVVEMSMPEPAVEEAQTTSKQSKPSGWGGKPTFANILKQQNEGAEGGAPVASKSNETPTKKPATNKKSQQKQPKQPASTEVWTRGVKAEAEESVAK